MGSHREPITSEKCWYDFAVRELSRLAAGKAKGQEAVWGAQCKPAWWDSTCRFPWKNPTANPKDSKDTLKVKFECLEQHLRKEGKLPSDIREEIELWKAGKYNEVFLMTSFSSILRQVSNAHAMIAEARRKMEEHGISVNPCIFKDLQNCLTGCLQQLDVTEILQNQNAQDNQKHKPSPLQGKRTRNTETLAKDLTEYSGPVKQLKLSPSHSVSSTLPSSLSSTASSVSQQTSVPVQTLNPECKKQMLNFLMKKSLGAKQREAMAMQTANEAPQIVCSVGAPEEILGNDSLHKVKMEESLYTKHIAPSVSSLQAELVPAQASGSLLNAAAVSADQPKFQMNDHVGIDFLDLELETGSGFELMDRFLEGSTETLSTSDAEESKMLESDTYTIDSQLMASQILPMSSSQLSTETNDIADAHTKHQDYVLTAACLIPTAAAWQSSCGFKLPTTVEGEYCKTHTKMEAEVLNLDDVFCSSDTGYSSDSSSSVDTESMTNSNSEISIEDMENILSWMTDEGNSSH